MTRILNNKLLGVVFIGLLLLGVWLINAVFTQKFVAFDKVTLNTDTIGLQLPARADVKVRGVIIGQVLEAKSEANGAVLTLGIKPSELGKYVDGKPLIPDNVTASILPKTLFGEKYVELEVPADAHDAALTKGDRITQTQLPIEVEKVLNDIYPLLRAVQPAELNYTLNALASALEGRGDAIGQNIETLDAYLKKLNPQVPALVEDLRLLSKVTGTYADVAPQIAETLRNTVTTGNTLLSREVKLHAFLKDVSAFSDTSKTFLDNNGSNIVRLGQLSKPQLELLNRYSPEFPCLLDALVDQAPSLASTFRGFVFHIDLITLPRQPRGYNAKDVPVLGADNGPNCLGLPRPKVPFRNVPNLNDGVDGLKRGDAQRTAPLVDAASTNAAAGSAEKAFFGALTAPVLGVPADEVPDLTTLLFGPLVAGTEVSVR
jgi:phospholipid/cholesterol/gamma-HCH transport system substrate-binding protein